MVQKPFVVWGPGDEAEGWTARGFGMKTTYEGVERFNTIYRQT